MDCFSIYPARTTKLGWSPRSILSLFSSLIDSISLPSAWSVSSLRRTIVQYRRVTHGSKASSVIKETVTLDLDCWLNLSASIIRNAAVNTRRTRGTRRNSTPKPIGNLSETLTRNDETRREGGLMGWRIMLSPEVGRTRPPATFLSRIFAFLERLIIPKILAFGTESFLASEREKRIYYFRNKERV